MPSSYRKYAINFSKSGQIDLIHNEVDVIGSIANYYAKHGWQKNSLVAIPATTIGDRYRFLNRDTPSTKKISLNKLSRMGLIPKQRIKLKHARVMVIELSNRYSKEYWLGFDNFKVIRNYNPNNAYAMAVFQLSEYIHKLRDRNSHA